MITQSELKDILHYDPETGSFTWLVALNRKFKNKIGTEAGHDDKEGYKIIGLFGKYYKLHRLAFLYMIGNFPEFQVDHINGIKYDNRWINLRSANNGQNKANSKAYSNNKLGVKGIVKRGDRFLVAIKHNGNTKHIGVYANLEDAKLAYAKAAIKAHGDFTHSSIKEDAEPEITNG